ncbi:ankyrin repeat domain-containing protein [Candidatus Parcubacteria bacterium]|nr:MAG: ankyrin repeat domain-containing protein [Candidatus Parcubacteria bacterium]
MKKGKGPVVVAAIAAFALVLSCFIFSGSEDANKASKTAHNDYEKATEIWLGTGAKIDEHNDWGKTPLIEAVEGGNAQFVSALLDAGAKIDKQGYSGDTALITAVRQGNEELVSVNIRPRDNTALITAVWEENTGIVSLLINANADVNMKNFSSETALSIAAKRENLPIMKLLIDAGAKADFLADTIFSERQEEKLVATLVSAGAYVDRLLYENADYETQKAILQDCLVNAILDGKTDDVRYLLNNGGDPVIPGSSGKIPLKLALQHRKKNIRDIIIQDCFFSALRTGKIEAVQILMDHGVNPKDSGLSDQEICGIMARLELKY